MAIPIFLAVHNAAGEIGHALLPRAEPFATTHLPDRYDGSIDLSVFYNENHSTVRLRVYDNCVMLTALPDALHKVHVQLPLGEFLAVPQSSKAETHWLILLDGAQFTYATLRCTIEFDHDHSISNSMKPPDIRRPIEHVSFFDDTDLLSDSLNAETARLNVSNPSKAAPDTAEQSPTPEPRTRLRSADRENASISKGSHKTLLQDRLSLDLNPKPPRLRATYKDRPLRERSPAEASNTAHDVVNPERATRTPSLPAAQVVGVLQQSGEASQVLEIGTSKQGVPPTRPSGVESQLLPTKLVSHEGQLTRQPGEESQVLHAKKAENLAPVTRRAGENSQLLRENCDIGSGEIPHEPTSVEQMQVRSTTSTRQIMESNLPTTTTKKVTFDVQTNRSESIGRAIPRAKAALSVPLAKPKPAAALPQVQTKQTSKAQSSKYLPVDSSDALASTVPRKRSASDVFSERTSPSKRSSRPASSNSPNEDDATDVSTVSVTVHDNSKGHNKRRRSPRNETNLLDPPARPAIVFSSKCEIQKKRQTMETFSDLGGIVTEDPAKANMLCVPNEDGLKKTSKLILAVVLGHVVVTESWLVQSCRESKFLEFGPYQPKDKARESEWGVKLPAALNRGLSSRANLDQLFSGYNLHLSKQLQDLLSRTNNLNGFIEIALAMGVHSVKKKLPVKARPRTIVLGVSGDFDASAVGKLGLSLYDKDLLTMSALRGRREDDKDEFKIDIPVKEEPLSQS